VICLLSEQKQAGQERRELHMDMSTTTRVALPTRGESEAQGWGITQRNATGSQGCHQCTSECGSSNTTATAA